MTTKFHSLRPWLNEVLEAIKKDIKSDYLPKDAAFYRAHFGNRPQNRLTAEEIYAAFSQELLRGNEELGEWVVNRWVFKHGDIYSHFADRLSRIQTNFAEIKQLTPQQSAAILEGASEAFGAKKVYLFSVLNDVVFPESVLKELAEKATASNAPVPEPASDLTQEVARLRKEIDRLNEKWAQKVEGVLKKYSQDTASLKHQVRALQEQLNRKGNG
jgi:hypothetical protein